MVGPSVIRTLAARLWSGGLERGLAAARGAGVLTSRGGLGIEGQGFLTAQGGRVGVFSGSLANLLEGAHPSRCVACAEAAACAWRRCVGSYTVRSALLPAGRKANGAAGIADRAQHAALRCNMSHCVATCRAPWLCAGLTLLLLADCQALRPTVFAATPAFWNGLHAQFTAELHKARPSAAALR